MKKRNELIKLEEEATKLTGLKVIRDKEYIKIKYKHSSEKSAKMIKSFLFKSSSKILWKKV